MKVLVTGGAGFIGSHLVERLLSRGDTVTVLDALTTGRRENLPTHPRLRLLTGSIAELPAVLDALQPAPDVVVHAAASYRVAADWGDHALTNVVGSAHVVQAAVKARVQRLIYLQTSLCYGLAAGPAPLTEGSPLAPGDSYAISKTAGEHYVRLADLDTYSFRLANIYGPRNLTGPLPAFYQRLTTGRPCLVVQSVRDFLYVADLVTLLVLAIDGQGPPGIYHAASGREVGIPALYETVRAQLGVSGPVELRAPGPDDAPTLRLDPTHTQGVFGWTASTTFEAGVSQALAWYQVHPPGETYSHLAHVLRN